jgi:hypothetical protein
MNRTNLAHDFLRRSAAGEGRKIGLTDSSVMDRIVTEQLLDGCSYELTPLGRATLTAWDREVEQQATARKTRPKE